MHSIIALSKLNTRHLLSFLISVWIFCYIQNTHTHARLTALFLELPRWAGTRKVKPIWILLKQKTVSGSGISWAICKSAPHSRQITMPAPHHSVFYRPDALPAAQPTASKHWRQIVTYESDVVIFLTDVVHIPAGFCCIYFYNTFDDQDGVSGWIYSPRQRSIKGLCIFYNTKTKMHSLILNSLVSGIQMCLLCNVFTEHFIPAVLL